MSEARWANRRDRRGSLLMWGAWLVAVALIAGFTGDGWWLVVIGGLAGPCISLYAWWSSRRDRQAQPHPTDLAH